MKKIHVLVLAFCAFLFSCSKDKDNGDNTPVPTEADKLQADLTAKWELDPELVNSLRPRNVVTPPSTINLFGSATKTSGSTITNESGPTPLSRSEAYVEFYADSTYFVTMDGYLLVEGKYRAVAADSVLLSSLGSMGGIRFTDNKLEGRLHYTELSMSVPVTGTKTATISGSDKTKTLARTWYLTKDEDGPGALEEGVDSITVRFSIYGTYLVQQFHTNEPPQSSVMKWKWASGSNETKFDYINPSSWPGEGIVTIRELTADVLKTSEWSSYDDESDEEEQRFTFRAVKK